MVRKSRSVIAVKREEYLPGAFSDKVPRNHVSCAPVTLCTYLGASISGECYTLRC
jgi:hypothetical protein